MARSRALLRHPTPALTTGPSATPPIWKEALWPVDWLSLRLSPIYYGQGVPHGDGSPVVLVPGFMGTDAYLVELYLWLERIGYNPYMSGIGLTVECPGRLTRRLLSTVERAQRETSRRVRIVGHSLGGLIGRRVCLERPDLCSQLVYLGSPLQVVRAHPAVLVTAAVMRLAINAVSPRRADCLTDACPCGFTQDLERALPECVQHAAIYSRGDGVVDWHDSQELDARLNHEVGGTHIGLVYNSRAYGVLARLLADASTLPRNGKAGH